MDSVNEIVTSTGAVVDYAKDNVFTAIIDSKP